jgi:FdhD protein
MNNTERHIQYRPRIEIQGQAPAPTHQVTVHDHTGRLRQIKIAGEFPLTIKVDGQEVITLMTLGTDPQELALGYLRNQRLVKSIEEIESVKVLWDTQTISVSTVHGNGIDDLLEKTSRRTISSGCGQGTLFSCTLDVIYETRLPETQVRQSTLYGVLKEMSHRNLIYKEAGSVHTCGLFQGKEALMVVEDIGRHNAADAIAGRMWLKGMPGENKIFYTTGRLTSEIIMKTAMMGIPVLLSRSSVTRMGLEVAEDLGMTLIGRAKAKRFLVYAGLDNLRMDVGELE